jgi:hypothetical protein
MGPPPNNCLHRLRGSLLEGETGTWLFARGVTVSFDSIDGASRVERARSLLAGAGLGETESLRSAYPLPAGRWLCRSLTAPTEAAEGENRPEEIPPLLAALILGLCGPSYYASDRPIIWSEARLSRRLALYSPVEYYEETNE